MNEIARDTFDYEKFTVITMLMWEAMENQRPAAWRVVFKGLTLLEHLVKNGSERCVDDARNHGHTLRSLGNFNYYEGTIDRGLGVREKTKQIMELLQDDERIREERQKARKLREKFGGNLGGTGSAGGGGGAYAGYGNDNWNSGGGGGYGNGGIGAESGGYGNGGIGSSRFSEGGGGRYDEDRGYSGRYDNDTAAPAASAPAPTFASIPDDPPKKTKAKKKKNKEPQPAAPEVDLFSFDAPAPAAAPAEDDDFAGFQSAEAPVPATAAPAVVDPFAATPQMQNQQQFDAFGGATQPQQTFGAFAAAPQAASTGPVMNGGMMQQQPQFASAALVGGGNPVMSGSMNVMGGNSHVMGGNMSSSAPMNQTSIGQPAAQQKSDFDDDFGDFSGAGGAVAPAVAMPGNSVDKLISLDGLSKNSDKKKDKLNEPIIANQAAATFVQERDHIQASVKQANKGSSMSFAGIDGLNKTSAPSFGGGQQMMMNSMAPAMSMGMNPSVMGSGGTSASTIGMLDPNALSGPLQSQPQQMQQQGMAMNPQMAMGGMGGISVNGGMQQGFQGMGMQAGNPGMMNNQSMGFNPSMMGGQAMGVGGMQSGGMQGTGMNNFGGMQASMNQQQQQQQQGFR